MKKWIALVLSVVLAWSMCGCELADMLVELIPSDLLPSIHNPSNSNNPNSPNPGSPSSSQAATQVTVKMFTEMIITQTHSDGSTTISRGVLEYDENHNFLCLKGYTDDVLLMEMTLFQNVYPLVQLYYNDDGTLSSRYEATYDDNGNELTYCAYGADGTLYWSYEYTYDANGNMLSETSYDEEGNIERFTTYTYAENGNMLTETDLDGVVTYYVYNAAGDLEKSYFTMGDTEYWNAYTYDSHGNLVCITSGSGDNEESLTTWEYTYNGDRIVEEKRYDDGVLASLVQYDSEGRTLMDIYYYDGEEGVKTTYTYDSMGNCTEEIHYYYGEETGRIVTTYDKNGVITNIKQYKDGVLRDEVNPIYQEVTVSEEVAQQIRLLHSLIYMI